MLTGYVPQPAVVVGEPVMIYSGPPADRVGVINALVCNRGGSGLARISIAVTKQAANAIASADWVTYDRELIESGEFEKGMLQIFPGEKVYIKTPCDAISVRAHGYERTGNGEAKNAAPAANTPVRLYTAPATKSASGGVLVVNRINQNVRVSIAITSAAINAIPNSAWVTFNRQMGANSEYEKNALAVMPGENVYYRSDSADTSVRGQFSIGDV